MSSDDSARPSKRGSGPGAWILERRWGIATALVALTPLFWLRADAKRGLDHLLHQFLIDDAFYYFEIARHFFEFNEGIPNSGFHPLYAFLIAPFHRALEPLPAVTASLTVLVLSISLGAVLLYRLLTNLWTPPLAFTCAAAYALSGRLYGMAMTGVETAMAATCLIAFFAVQLSIEAPGKPRPSSRQLAGLGLLAGLSFLARMDTPVILAPAVAFQCLRSIRAGHVRDAVVLLVSCCVLPLVWMTTIWILTGSPMPTSTTAVRILQVMRDADTDPVAGALDLAAGLLNSVPIFFLGTRFKVPPPVATGYLLAFCVAGAWALKDRPDIGHLGRVRHFTLLLLVGYVGWTAYYVFYQGRVRPWYLAQLAPLAYGVILPLSLAVLYRWVPRPLAIPLIAAFVLWIVSGTLTPKPVGPNVYDKYLAALAANEVFAEQPPKQRVASFNTGAYDYFMDLDVLNLDGVVNPEVHPALRDDELPRYVEERDIGFLIEHDPAANLDRIRDDERFELDPWIDLTARFPAAERGRPKRTYLWKVRVIAP